MMCCACAGSCNHVGNHWFCEAHGGKPTAPMVTTSTTHWTYSYPPPPGGRLRRWLRKQARKI